MILRRLYLKLFPQYRRLDIQFVSYADADRLIREGEGKPENERWTIAREEDTNPIIGRCFIERRERVTE